MKEEEHLPLLHHLIIDGCEVHYLNSREDIIKTDEAFSLQVLRFTNNH